MGIGGKNVRNNKNKLEKRNDLEQALKEYKQQTGIDYMKWLMGDTKEQMRFRFKQWQDKMKADLEKDD